MWIGIMFLFLSIIAAVLMTVYYKRMGTDRGRKKKNINKDDSGEMKVQKQSTNKLRKRIGIKKIKDKVIKLNDGNYRLILSISSPDFELLTEEEQSQFENSLMQFGLSLNFPVQFYTTTIKIETKEPVKIIDNFLNNEENIKLEKLRIYANNLKIHLEAKENERGVQVRQSFCVVGTSFVTYDKRMLMELKNRADTVVTGLSAARMKVSILNSDKIAQLLSDYFNKHSNINIKNMIENGAMELYSDGLGVVIYDVKEKETEKAV